MRPEDEETILPDWAAEGAAELVEDESGRAELSPHGTGQDLVPGVQNRALVVLKEATVILVSARPGDQVDIPTQGLPVLGLDDTLDGLHLLNCFNAQQVDVVEPLIHRGRRPLRAAAGLGPIHRDPRPAPSQAVESDTALAGGGDAGT